MPLDLNSLRKAGVPKKLAQLLVAGGGGGNPWKSRLALPLTTLVGWTVGTGTWAADATGLHQTDPAQTMRRLRYTASRLSLASVVIELEIRFDTELGVAGINVRTGPGEVTGGQRIFLKGDGTNVTQVSFEADSVTNYGTYNLDTPIPYGTWVKLRVTIQGSAVVVYINDVLLTNAYVGNTNNGPYLGLDTYDCAASFRNLKVWSPAEFNEV